MRRHAQQSQQPIIRTTRLEWQSNSESGTTSLQASAAQHQLHMREINQTTVSKTKNSRMKRRACFIKACDAAKQTVGTRIITEQREARKEKPVLPLWTGAAGDPRDTQGKAVSCKDNSISCNRGRREARQEAGMTAATSEQQAAAKDLQTDRHSRLPTGLSLPPSPVISLPNRDRHMHFSETSDSRYEVASREEAGARVGA